LSCRRCRESDEVREAEMPVSDVAKARCDRRNSLTSTMMMLEGL